MLHGAKLVARMARRAPLEAQVSGVVYL
jgi:hypothetical protein